MYEKFKSWGPGKVFAGIVVLAVVLVLVNNYFFGHGMGRNSFTVMESTSVPGFAMGMGGGAPMAIESDMVYRGEAKMGRIAVGADPSSITIYPPQAPIPASTPKIPEGDRKIIKNGSLDLLVKNADDAVKGITAVAATYKGFVDGSTMYEITEGVRGGSITIRVPGELFAQAMEDIKKLAVKVRNENTNSNDITAQYIDLEARLKNLKAEEAQYQEIMKRATKIEDVLNVSSHLYQTRGQIESTQGQLNYLSRQVDMSTISVSLTSEAEVEVFGIIWRPLTVLKQAMRAGLTDLAGFVDWLVFSIFKLPVLLLRLAVFVLVVAVLWKLVYWVGQKFFKKKSK